MATNLHSAQSCSSTLSRTDSEKVTSMEIPEKVSASFELAKELLGKKVRVTMDRPLGSRHPKYDFVYEVNYGYIAGIKAPDGEDLDAYFLGVDIPLQTGEGICIAIAHRRDNDDDKLIVAPEGTTISDTEILSAIHFQEQWFDTTIYRRSPNSP